MRIETVDRIRDSIYGDINISETEREIIKTDSFQRLRWISQLGAVQLIYPGATHTRYSHSLGVLHNATRFANTLKFFDSIDLEYLRYAALLHDICELPFERLFQEYFRVPGLEEKRLDIIEEVCDNVKIEFDIIQKIISPSVNTNNNKEYRYLNKILFSDFGADRTDFLVRDSTLSGVKYGLIDDRIFHAFHLTKAKELFIKAKELPVVESVISCFYHTKYAVYDHVMVRSALSILREAIETSMMARDVKNPLYLLNNESRKNSFVFKTDY
ncbi:MAG: HD domain-containing protein, partial [Candidatus Bathyarchaeota archaeon]|nr:HD domain-containing protein [Candidatus Bathyarchaeota archaeon]